jgi:predicted  nucleic acid-binding Zn-ribbon protein
MTTVAVAMDQAIERASEVKQGYEDAIVTQEAHIQLCQDYLDGKKGEHPFSEPDLREEITTGWKTIALIRGEMEKHAGSVERLRAKLDEAIREPVEIILDLQRKEPGEIKYAPVVRQSSEGSDPSGS